MALQSVMLTLELSLKMPDRQRKASRFVAFKTDVSIKWKVVYSEFAFEVTLKFPERRGIELPICV